PALRTLDHRHRRTRRNSRNYRIGANRGDVEAFAVRVLLLVSVTQAARQPEGIRQPVGKLREHGAGPAREIGVLVTERATGRVLAVRTRMHLRVEQVTAEHVLEALP